MKEKEFNLNESEIFSTSELLNLLDHSGNRCDYDTIRNNLKNWNPTEEEALELLQNFTNGKIKGLLYPQAHYGTRECFKYDGMGGPVKTRETYRDTTENWNNSGKKEFSNQTNYISAAKNMIRNMSFSLKTQRDYEKKYASDHICHRIAKVLLPRYKQ